MPLMNQPESNSDLMKRMFPHNDYRREILMRAMEDQSNDNSEYYVLEGKAATFNEETVLFEYGGNTYKEIIDSAAFKEADLGDVFLKYNHSNHMIVVARTKNNTLEINIKEDGVYIRAKILKSMSVAKDLYEAVRSGLIDKMSFAFTIKDEGFNQETFTWTVYRVKKVYDVAAVEVPAYDNTFIYARRKGEVEARLKEVETSEIELKRNIALARLKRK